jgi:hypothetical protein
VAAQHGQGIANNSNSITSGSIAGGITTSFNIYNAGLGNEGFLTRQSYINFDPLPTDATTSLLAPVRYYQLLAPSETTALYKSYIFNKVNGVNGTTKGIMQIAVTATIYLKHIHSFFNSCPLLKGVFMKLTMNLNNTTTEFECGSTVTAAANTYIACSRVSNPISGINPAMIASVSAGNGSVNLLPATPATDRVIKYKYNISVGNKVLDSTMTQTNGPLATQIYLYVPTYAFNPVFEQAYLSSPVKSIVYTDVYQYQIENISGGGTTNFNNLLTNGIANIKSVLILPFFSNKGTQQGPAKYATEGESITLSANSGFLSGIPVFQSPFDTAGTGTTSPLTLIKNFNIQISGQNAIYNMQKYAFEQFNHQLLGVNAVNGGLTDGLTSGLIDSLGFEMAYTYYYVNVGRMLPSTMSVPKSVQITGTISCVPAVDLFCFIEYEINSLKIDIQTGARVQ